MTFSPALALQEAVALHRRGAVDEAIVRYNDLLRHDPRSVEGLYYLAMARCQRGQFVDGIETIGRALALAPNHAAAHNLLGMALSRTGRTQDALASFDRAIAHRPDFAEAHGNRAGALTELGAHGEALKAYDRALALDPASLGDWMNRGALQLDMGLHDDAVASFDRTLALAPSPEGHFNRANALRASGRNAEAVDGYDRALALRPNFAEAHANRGLVLRDLGRQAEALESLDRALTNRPSFAEAFVSRGLLHLADDRVVQALADFDRALAINPRQPAAWRHRALALSRIDRFAEAVESCDRALALEPGDAMSHFVRGLALFNLGRDRDALASLDAVVARRPDDARAHSERAVVLNALDRVDEAFGEIATAQSLDAANPFVAGAAGDIFLLRGRWAEGWPLYEHRFAVDPAGILATGPTGTATRKAAGPAGLSDFPRWKGEPPDGRPLVLVTEQGLGDAIQFARFATALATAGHRVAILTAPVLAPLLSTVPGVERVLADPRELAGLGAFRWSPFLSVPAIIGLTPDTVPSQVPYVAVDEARVQAWRERLGPGGYKIGLAWQGNPNFRFDHGRSIALAQFAPLAAIDGVRLISLQKQPGAEQIASVAFADRIETPADATDRGASALLDLTALMQAVDLVVTADSMPAHLAGALGRPAFVALRRRMLDWRWLPEWRERSPWYPTLRLYRQAEEGDWHAVFARIAADVARAVSGAQGA